eukprot:7602785-Pyramimonas_sp.AAC.1
MRQQQQAAPDLLAGERAALHHEPSRPRTSQARRVSVAHPPHLLRLEAEEGTERIFRARLLPVQIRGTARGADRKESNGSGA